MSCAPSTKELEKEGIFTFENSELKYGLELERRLGSKDITRSRRVGLGKGIYPNKRNFKLEISRDLKRVTDSSFSQKADYHFTQDSTIRVIMYEWNRGKIEGSGNAMDKKFNHLKKILDNYFGEPYFTEFPTDSVGKRAYRDGVKWQNKNGLNAYLFAFRGRNTSYSQIRLSVYPE